MRIPMFGISLIQHSKNVGIPLASQYPILGQCDFLHEWQVSYITTQLQSIRYHFSKISQFFFLIFFPFLQLAVAHGHCRRSYCLYKHRPSPLLVLTVTILLTSTQAIAAPLSDYHPYTFDIANRLQLNRALFVATLVVPPDCHWACLVPPISATPTMCPLFVFHLPPPTTRKKNHHLGDLAATATTTYPS